MNRIEKILQDLNEFQKEHEEFYGYVVPSIERAISELEVYLKAQKDIGGC